jgi:WbqC-like protein family
MSYSQQFVNFLPYLPSISWYASALHCDVVIVSNSRYNKHLHLNKTLLSSSNGPLHISIPIQGGRNQRTLIQDVLLDNSVAWKEQHFKTIKALYGRTPFYEYLIPYIQEIYNHNSTHLLTFNLQLIKALNAFLGVEMLLQFEDHCANISAIPMLDVQYQQSFMPNVPFVPNASMLDLVMHQGRGALKYF